jgi:chromate transporter
MVVAFVGFVGGWTREIFGTGAGALPAAGIAAACVATFFTFLPSFLFILAGGPLIESTHGRLRFTAALSAISAAVVGVVVNLATFFAWHVFWPTGAAAGILASVDGFAVMLFALAAAALFRFRIGVVPVIAACAAAGLARVLVAAG